jgi:ATP-dependent Lhr-like helicase
MCRRLKALSYDVEKNLRAPLRGIGAELNVAIRTGDTPQEGAARHGQAPARRADHDAGVALTDADERARAIFEGTETVILDEIHAVAQTKRGAHLAITLERLSSRRPRRAADRAVATQNPLEEVGRFMVGPKRTCTIVDTGVRKPLDLKIHVPVESMVEPEQPTSSSTRSRARRRRASRSGRRSTPSCSSSCASTARRSSSSTTGARRAARAAAERARRGDIARAHHGSLAREERLVVEEQLKAGDLPCLVATSSLELGIDMGRGRPRAAGRVAQVGDAGLQRIGRLRSRCRRHRQGPHLPQVPADLLRVRRGRAAECARA